MIATRTAGTRDIPLDKLVLDRDYYIRVHDNWQTVCRYKEAMMVGNKFPPLDVAPDGNGDFVVLDGWHRTQAARQSGRKTIACIVHSKLKPEKWVAFAVERNRPNARQLSKEDRIYVAVKLDAVGYDLEAMAKLIGVQGKTLSLWLTSSTVKDEDGETRPVKSAMRPLVGTKGELDALRYAGPVAKANVRQALDETLAFLKAGLVDVTVLAMQEKAVEIHERLGKLLSPKKRGKK